MYVKTPAAMEHIELGHGAWVDFAPDWLGEAEARSLHAAVERGLSWEQRHVVLFGKRILQPRLIAWAGELPYRYSGQTLEPRPWPEGVAARLASLASGVSDAAWTGFNHVLVNRYRDGRDSMGFHADAEPELGPDPVVATVSLGCARRFLLRAARASGGGRALELELGGGSLLIMGGTCQRHYRHAVPRQASAAGERISLTYRRLLRAPA